MDEKKINEVLQTYRDKVLKYRQQVTVFVLTYNRSKYLKIALDSILKQTYKNYTLIVLDNMSTDNTSDIVNEISDDRLLYIRRSSGVYPNNEFFAFDNNITPYLVVFHDDDIINKEYLRKMMDIMEKNEDYSVASCTSNIIDSDGEMKARFVKKNDFSLYEGHSYLEKFISRTFGNDYSIIYPAALYRYSFFKNKKDIYNSEIGPAFDQYVWFDCERRGGKLYVLGDALINYRVHSYQDSSINKANMDLRLINAIYRDEYYKEIIDNADKKNLHKFLRISLNSLVKSYIKDSKSIAEAKNTYSLINLSVFCDELSLKYISLFKKFINHPKLYSFVFKIRHFRLYCFS